MGSLNNISIDDLILDNHNYRKFKAIWSFKNTQEVLMQYESQNNYKGFGILRLFKCLLLQFMENLSDRELERYMQENIAAKWFCDFDIAEKTPDFTVFTKTRKRIGTNTLSRIFNDLKLQLKAHGLISETFTFIDASHLIAKANLWEERDKAIADKYENLNNENISKFAHDDQARIGCKGKNKYWYGYKQNVSLDMQSGLINKIAVTFANITDAVCMKHVLPDTGAVYADKAYCVKPAQLATKSLGLHLAAIKNNNMKSKNKDLDKWYSHIRSPYERVFSQREKRVRYKGIAKNQFASFMSAICFNLKRLLVLDLPHVILN